jgi:hypothetical protein
LTLLFVTVKWPVSAEKEQKLYAAAALRVIQTYPPSIELRSRNLGGGKSVVTYGRPPNTIPYKSISEFYAVNPKCCELVDRDAEGWQPSLLDKLLGLHSHIVRVRYAIRKVEPGGTVVTTPHETFIVLTRSGKVTHI